MSDHIDLFRDAIQTAGLIPPDTILDDGAIHRFNTNGKPHDDSGWYMLHSDGIPAGAFGCWRVGLQSTWCAKADTAMSTAEHYAHRARTTAMQALRDAEQVQRRPRRRGGGHPQHRALSMRTRPPSACKPTACG